MALIAQRMHDRWKRCDPLLRIFTYTCVIVLVWRISIAVVAFPSVKLNFNDYIWMTKFFGMSNLMYLALVFSGFGLIPSFSSAFFFGSTVMLAAVVRFRVTRSPLLFQFVMCCAAIIGITIAITINPSLKTVAVQVLPTLMEGTSVPVWIPIFVEYAFGIMLCRVMARRYFTNMSRRKRNGKPGGDTASCPLRERRWWMSSSR